MRILRVITRLDVHGGAELSTLVEMEHLAARGHELEVVTLSEPTTDAAIRRLDAAGIAHRHLGLRVPLQVRELRRQLARRPPDVAHAVIMRAEVVTAFAAARTPVATVASLVNMQYAPSAVAQAPSPRKLELVRRSESAVLRYGFDRYHCLTRAGADHSVEHLGVDRSRIVVVPRGRSRESLAVAPDAVEAVRHELAPGGGPLLVNVGRHELQKGQDLLFDVVERLRRDGTDVALAVAGREGRRTPQLAASLRTSGLEGEVRLLGARPDVPALLSAADVVCVTSRWEGLGGSIIEALGAGAPVVAFGVPAVAEVVGEAGVLVEPFDVDAFASEVASLLADPSRRRELGEAARARFDRLYEIDAVVERLEGLYAGLGR